MLKCIGFVGTPCIYTDSTGDCLLVFTVLRKKKGESVAGTDGTEEQTSDGSTLIPVRCIGVQGCGREGLGPTATRGCAYSPLTSSPPTHPPQSCPILPNPAQSCPILPSTGSCSCFKTPSSTSVRRSMSPLRLLPSSFAAWASTPRSKHTSSTNRSVW
jgi:hypothetical protein